MNAAREIVEAILNNLEGRKGVGNELEAIDRDIYDEMVETLVELTEKIIEDKLL